MPLMQTDVVRYIQQSGSRPVDLSGQDLSGLRLNGRTGMFDLMEADLSNTNMQGVHLTHINMRRARLTGANLSYATLVDCHLEESEGIQSNFSYATLVSVFFNAGNYFGSSFAGASGREPVVFDAANLGLTSFKDARLYSVSARQASFAKACFDNATLVIDAYGANMQRASFREARIIGSDLEEAILLHTDMAGTQFNGVSALGAKFSYEVIQEEWVRWLPTKSGTALSDLELCLSWHDLPNVLFRLKANEAQLPQVLAFVSIKKKLAMDLLLSWFVDALYPDEESATE